MLKKIAASVALAGAVALALAAPTLASNAAASTGQGSSSSVVVENPQAFIGNWPDPM